MLIFIVPIQGLNNNLLPLLGSIILGLQRLLPAFQIGYASWINITTNVNSVLDLIKLLDQPENKKIASKNYFYLRMK